MDDVCEEFGTVEPTSSMPDELSRTAQEDVE